MLSIEEVGLVSRNRSHHHEMRHDHKTPLNDRATLKKLNMRPRELHIRSVTPCHEPILALRRCAFRM